MSKIKNEEILNNIFKTNFLGLNKQAIVSSMMKQEVAGQRVFYVFLKQKLQNDYLINPESMDKNQSDGIVGNTIIECKLNENESGGVKKAYQELYYIIPNRLKQKGDKIPYYRIYIELETFLVEVYDCHCILKEKFDWYENPEKFKRYFEDTKETYEYDLLDENVDLVEVIQNLYKVFNIKQKIDAYKKLQEGIIGWFKPFDIEKNNVNKIILNNDKMNEKYVQKMQGAFFTPSKYISKSTQYVLNAIKKSKEDGYDDYVIVDRCAGVGNLESQFDKSVFSHFILGTINEAETLTANIRFGDLAKCHTIDALSEDGLNFYLNEIENYKKTHNVKKLAIIFLENPPYVQLNSNKKGGVGNTENNNRYIKTYIHQEMDKEQKVCEDLDEQFVWSVFKYFNVYSYIHYGPIKIWKTRHFIDKQIEECYLCNKKFFNAGESAIALIHWKNIDKKYEEIHFKNDIDDDFVVKKVYNTISRLYKNDGKESGICVIEARNFSFDSPRLTGSINDNGKYGSKWISKENLLKVIPLFCLCRDSYGENGKIIEKDGNIKYDYRVIGTLYKTSDKFDEYQQDNIFLQNCLLWCLTTHLNQCSNKCKIWSYGESILDSKLKDNKIWKIYKELVNDTGLNGLYNIEQFNKIEYGKLWKEHNLYPKIKEVKQLLDIFYRDNIRPYFFKYDLLK